MRAFVWLCLFSLAACGDGDFSINRQAGEASALDLRGETDSGQTAAAARTYFLDNIFPLMSSEEGTTYASDTSVKGCLGGGCHNTQTSNPTFFQIDPGDRDRSWDFARVRRTKILFGEFAPEPPSSARTLYNRNRNAAGDLLPRAQRHNSFQNWTDAELSLIDLWTALPEN